MKAVTRENARAEFYLSLPADGDGETKQETKRRTFGRLADEAIAKGLIAGDWRRRLVLVRRPKGHGDMTQQTMYPDKPDTGQALYRAFVRFIRFVLVKVKVNE